MNTYQIADVLLRLVAAGVQSAFLLDEIRQMEGRGDSPERIYQYLSDLADQALADGSEGGAAE